MNIKKSLQSLKAEIEQKEMILKSLYKIHPHLIHLSEKGILTYFEVKSMDELKPYIDSTIPYGKDAGNLIKQNISVCTCTDSHGKTKDLYDSEEAAQKEASIFAAQKKIQLKVYVCPNGCGWHLTKG